MVGPTSTLVIIVLLAGCAASVFLIVRARHWVLQVVSGTLVVALGVVIGIAAVNDYYGYYRSWSAVYDAVSGGNAGLTVSGGVIRSRGEVIRAGDLRVIALPGRTSHINRNGLIYLPPEYNDPHYAHQRFPVVELLHGSPGEPADWQRSLRISTIASLLIGRHLMGPMVLVMPAINGNGPYLDCVNGRYGADETYIASDVPKYIRLHYRVSTEPSQWGIGGFSSGGYCAANLGLRHRASFGAVGVLDGYFRAHDGSAEIALGGNQAQMAANSPLEIARRLPPGTTPLPPFWLAAGTADRADYQGARAFIAAMSPLEQVSVAMEEGAGHDSYAWSAAVPVMLAWMWQQLAPPAMRVEFPIRGPASSVQVPPVIYPRHRHQPPPRSPSRSRGAPTREPTTGKPSPASPHPSPTPTPADVGSTAHAPLANPPHG